MAGQRAYGAEHRRTRAAALATWSPGDLCARCRHDIDPSLDRLDLDHDEHGGYLGLSHNSPCRICGERCNQKAGGEKAATLAGKRLRGQRCVVCGMPFRATSGSAGSRQVTCGRQRCMTEIRRRRRAREGDGDPPEVSGRIW